MFSTFNDFFEISNFKIELEFINKAIYPDRFEKMKNSIKINFSEFIFHPNQNPDIILDISDFLNNPNKSHVNIIQQTYLLDEYAETLKFLSGKLLFNKFFEISDLKNNFLSYKNNLSKYYITK